MPSYWISVDGTTKKISQRRYFRLLKRLERYAVIHTRPLDDGMAYMSVINYHGRTITLISAD